MSRRQQLLRARHVADDDYVPRDDVEERLSVSAYDTGLIRAEDEKEELADMRSAFEAARCQQEQASAS